MSIFATTILVCHLVSGPTPVGGNDPAGQIRIKPGATVDTILDEFLSYVADHADLSRPIILQQYFHDQYNWDYICTPRGSDDWSIRGTLSGRDFEIQFNGKLPDDRLEKEGVFRQALNLALLKRKETGGSSGYFPAMFTAYEDKNSWNFFYQRLPLGIGKHAIYKVDKTSMKVTFLPGR